VALAELNRERQQKRIRDAQELTKCLTSGMGLLTPDQVRQIANAVTHTNNEPMETLRRLGILIEENPHASSADLNEAVESAVQALITGAKNTKERQRKPGPSQPQGSWRDVFKLMEDDQRRDIRQLEAAVGMRESIETSSTPSTRSRRGLSTRTPFPWTGGSPCRCLTSWVRESAPGSRWFQPVMTNRSRGIGDLDMAGLHIGAPARLQRGGRMLQPDSASTQLGRGPGELPPPE
jgi:hypothetical protein